LRGAVIGQFVPILAMPLISRLYAPDEYGIFASLLSFAVLLTALMTLQLEVAVVLPEDDATASKVARASFQITVTGFLIFAVLILAAQPFLSQFQGLAHWQGWSMLAPLIGFLMAMLLLGNYISSRLRVYGEIGRGTASLQIVNCSAAVILGLLKPTAASLVMARVIGQGAALTSFKHGITWLKDQYKQHGILPVSQIRDVLSRYRKFPLFTLPQNALAMASREGVTVILLVFHQPIAAGFYALVRSVLMIPSSLLSTSVGPVFYREASQAIDKPEFRLFSFELMLAIACIMAPASVYIANWGPEIFAFVFGLKWMQAGIYALIYMPLSVLFLLTIWCGRVFEIRNKQDVLFRIQLIFDTASIGLLIALLARTDNPVLAVGAYVTAQCVYLLVQLGFIFNILHLNAGKYALLIGAAIGTAAVQYGLHIAAKLPTESTLSHFVVESLITAGITAGTVLFFWRLLKRNPVMNLA